MVDWAAASFDPVAARGGVNGADYVNRIFDQAATMNAGRSFAAGDYGAAVKTLASRGNFKDAEGIAQFGNQQLDRQQQHFNQSVPVLEQVYQSTLDKQGPDAAKAAVVSTFDNLASDFPQYGIAPEKAQAFRQSLSADPQRTLQTAGMLARGKFIFQQNGDSIVAIDPNTQRPAWSLTNGKLVNVPEGGKLVPQPQSFRDFTAPSGQLPAAQAGNYAGQIAGQVGSQSQPPPSDGGHPAFQEMYDSGKPGNPGRGSSDPAGTIYGSPKPPTTRRIVQGNDDVSQEFDSATGQWREIGRGPRRQAGGNAAGGPFGAGRTEDERLRATLLSGDPSSPQYAAAYSKLAAPKVMFDPQTGQQINVTPDLSWARPPSRGNAAPGGAPGPGAAAIPVQGAQAPGQPTVTAAPGRAGTPTRATYDANLNQAQNDIDLAERMLFPGGQFDRSMAMTGVGGGIPLTQGREARQAIRRAVEILLRQRTGAAAPDSEVNSYTSMFAPGALDNDDGARVKMQRLRQFFEDSRTGSASKLPGANSGPQGDPISQARDAIARGADRGAVIQRLRQNGIDPGGL